MIFDYECMFCEDQTLAIDAGSVASTNVVDLQKAGIGRGEPVKLFCQMTDDLVIPSNGTLTAVLQTDDNENFTSATALITSAAATSATAVAGYRPIDVQLPSNVERYVRLYFTIANQNATGGTITGGLILDQQTNKDPVALGLTS